MGGRGDGAQSEPVGSKERRWPGQEKYIYASYPQRDS